MFKRCTGQLRSDVSIAQGPEGPHILRVVTGLDFAAVIAFAERRGAMSALFIDLLPEVEALIVRASNREG